MEKETNIGKWLKDNEKTLLYLGIILLMFALLFQTAYNSGFDAGVRSVGQTRGIWNKIPPINVAISFAIIMFGISRVIRIWITTK